MLLLRERASLQLCAADCGVIFYFLFLSVHLPDPFVYVNFFPVGYVSVMRFYGQLIRGGGTQQPADAACVSGGVACGICFYSSVPVGLYHSWCSSSYLHGSRSIKLCIHGLSRSVLGHLNSPIVKFPELFKSLGWVLRGGVGGGVVLMV